MRNTSRFTLVALLATIAITATLAANQPVLEIPFEDTGHVVIPVTINDSEQLRASLDTGMPMGGFLLDPALGKSLELEYVGVVNVGGGGGGATKTASIANGVAIRIGAVVFNEQRLGVLKERHDFAGLGFDVVVGETVDAMYSQDLLHQPLKAKL